MARFFVQFLAIYNNVNFPKTPDQAQTFAQILFSPSINFAKSGHTGPDTGEASIGDHLL